MRLIFESNDTSLIFSDFLSTINMDDEDGDPGNMETWNVHNSATIDGISVKETLMRANGSQQHLDNIDDPKVQFNFH